MLYKDKKIVWLFLAPAVLMMAVFLYYPFVKNIADSFFNIPGLGAAKQTFIGFDNYVRLIGDPFIAIAVKNTLIMMGLTILVQVGLALVLALMVDAVRRGQQFFRTVFFFPIVISATAIGLMINLFYSYDGGMFNQLLRAIGAEPVLWLSEDKALLMVAAPVIWQYIGFYFVIIITGLNGIPHEIFESATLDGVSGLKKIRYITLPLIWDVLKVCVVLSVTGAIKVFDLPWVIAQNGAPNGLTHFTGTYMYFKTFISQSVGYGSSIAVLIVALGLVISLTASRLLRHETVVL